METPGSAWSVGWSSRPSPLGSKASEPLVAMTPRETGSTHAECADGLSPSPLLKMLLKEQERHFAARLEEERLLRQQAVDELRERLAVVEASAQHQADADCPRFVVDAVRLEVTYELNTQRMQLDKSFERVEKFFRTVNTQVAGLRQELSDLRQDVESFRATKPGGAPQGAPQGPEARLPDPVVHPASAVTLPPMSRSTSFDAGDEYDAWHDQRPAPASAANTFSAPAATGSSFSSGSAEGRVSSEVRGSWRLREVEGISEVLQSPTISCDADPPLRAPGKGRRSG